MLTGIGSEMYSPTVVLSPPVVNEVTGGSPPTNRYGRIGLLPQGLAPSLMLWVTFVPAGMICVHGTPTIPLRFGPDAIRLNPPQVSGSAVAPGYGGTGEVQPVVPGGCVPGAARSLTPQPKPTPVPSQVRKPVAAPALGA